jgi:hypothetical protein
MICLIFQDSISQLALILFSMSDFAHSYMSILLYHHKQLAECSEEVEQIEVKVTIKKRRGLTKSKEESEEDFPLLQPPAPARQLKLSEFQSREVRQKRKKVSKRIQSIIRLPSVRLLHVFLLLLLCTKSRLVFVVVVVEVIS